jgi:hypothetical protein
MTKENEQKESCPVCLNRTTFGRGEPKPCDTCNVPLVAWVPIFKMTESGSVLRISAEAAEKLRDLYVI